VYECVCARVRVRVCTCCPVDKNSFFFFSGGIHVVVGRPIDTRKSIETRKTHSISIIRPVPKTRCVPRVSFDVLPRAIYPFFFFLSRFSYFFFFFSPLNIVLFFPSFYFSPGVSAGERNVFGSCSPSRERARPSRPYATRPTRFVLVVRANDAHKYAAGSSGIFRTVFITVTVVRMYARERRSFVSRNTSVFAVRMRHSTRTIGITLTPDTVARRIPETKRVLRALHVCTEEHKCVRARAPYRFIGHACGTLGQGNVYVTAVRTDKGERERNNLYSPPGGNIALENITFRNVVRYYIYLRSCFLFRFISPPLPPLDRLSPRFFLFRALRNDLYAAHRARRTDSRDPENPYEYKTPCYKHVYDSRKDILCGDASREYRVRT
jgi:hypothetical protein